MNEKKDREKAMNKISMVLPHLPNTEFILIAIPDTENPQNANPNAAAVSVVAPLVGNGTANRPSRAPYIGYWRRGDAFEAVRWYKIIWNQHLPLAGCAAQINFNSIMQKLR